MIDFFRELIGLKCDFNTTDGEYRRYVLKDISGSWIVVEKDMESVYLNLDHVISIRISGQNGE